MKNSINSIIAVTTPYKEGFLSEKMDQMKAKNLNSINKEGEGIMTRKKSSQKNHQFVKVVESDEVIICPSGESLSKTDVDIILHEHDTLRAEIMERMRNQNNYVIVAVTILSAVLGYLGHIYEVWVERQYSNLLSNQLNSSRFISIFNGLLPTSVSVKPLPDGELLLFLNQPVPKIVILFGGIVLNSIAALFIHNEKNKTLTVQYLYNYLAPRLNSITKKTNPIDYHLHWRDYRSNRRAKTASNIGNFFLFFSYYGLTLLASITLFSITMWAIHTYEGLGNQPIFFKVFELFYAFYSVILIVAAIKAYYDKRYSDRPSRYKELNQESDKEQSDFSGKKSAT